MVTLTNLALKINFMKMRIIEIKKFNSYIIPHKRLEIQETENIDKIKNLLTK